MQRFGGHLNRAMEALNANGTMSNQMLSFVETHGLYHSTGTLAFVLDPNIHAALLVHALSVAALEESSTKPDLEDLVKELGVRDHVAEAPPRHPVVPGQRVADDGMQLLGVERRSGHEVARIDHVVAVGFVRDDVQIALLGEYRALEHCPERNLGAPRSGGGEVSCESCASCSSARAGVPPRRSPALAAGAYGSDRTGRMRRIIDLAAVVATLHGSGRVGSRRSMRLRQNLEPRCEHERGL